MYRYDALNRLKSARTFTGNNALAFLSKYSYDQGGNITKLKRHDASGNIIDSMAYSYTLNSASKPLNNKLNSVNDLGNATGMPTGISAYTYDADGRLSRDVKEKLLMRWTLDNKVAQVTKGNRYIRYWYDASGNRVMKRLHGDTVDYILRDASGTELQRIVRRQNSGASPILLSRESSLYGSSRLGTYAFSPNPGNDSTERRTNAKTTYELTDHLGNVRATVSDQKTYTAITGGYSLAANVLSALDNYPFGMVINTRSFSAGSYRFGFNGHEKNDEVTGIGNGVDMGDRWLDTRLGRTPKLDAKAKKYLDISPYAFAANNPIFFNDPDGKELKAFSVASQELVLKTLTYAFGKEHGFSFQNNILIHNGESPKNFTPQQSLLFKYFMEVLVNSCTITTVFANSTVSTKLNAKGKLDVGGITPVLNDFRIQSETLGQVNPGRFWVSL